MKKRGILNPHLAHVVASMGHTDKLVVCDSGLPIPRGANVVNLALTRNIPRFIDTVRVLLEEMEVEKVIIAEEMQTEGEQVYDDLLQLLPGKKIERVSHEEFKHLTCNGTVAFVRTGEATPFANVILVSGVTFG